MEEKVVTYDETEFVWNFGKLISKFPDEMLSHSLVFKPQTKSKNKKEPNEITKLKEKHQEEILYLKNMHFNEINDLKKKNEEDLQFWKDRYIQVKQYLKIVLNFNLHQK